MIYKNRYKSQRSSNQPHLLETLSGNRVLSTKSAQYPPLMTLPQSLSLLLPKAIPSSRLVALVGKYLASRSGSSSDEKLATVSLPCSPSLISQLSR